MSAFFVILGFLVVWLFEVIPLIRDKDKRKVIFYSILMLISLSVSLMVLFSSKETSMAAVIERIMKAMTKYIKI